MRPHVPVQRAQVRELLPAVARHLLEQRSLAVHDLVVRERQHEVLRTRVHHAEGQLVMVVTPVHGIVGEVVEGVVHPAHVPLEAEAEPSLRRRARDAGPRGRLLRDREHTGLGRVDGLVEQAEELDGVEVFAATLRVGLPLPRGARVVEVQHRRHRIDAQAVDVVLAQPA